MALQPIEKESTTYHAADAGAFPVYGGSEQSRNVGIAVLGKEILKELQRLVWTVLRRSPYHVAKVTESDRVHGPIPRKIYESRILMLPSVSTPSLAEAAEAQKRIG